MLIQANSGGGKSYALRKLIEQTAPHIQQFVIDPEGEFASLREKFDFVICAAEGGDALADPRTAKQLAHKLLEAGVSAVFDIYELDPDDRMLFVSRFCRAMVEAPKALWRPCMVVIDEAQDFAPERGSKKRGNERDATGSIIALSAKGRKRGFTVCCATQRLSRFNKDVAAELQNKLLGLAGLPIDVKANAIELGMTTREAQAIFPRLAPGEFYAFGPAISRFPIKLRLGKVETTHPEPGQLAKGSPPAPSDRLREILAGLSDLPEAHEDDPETLHKRIAELEDQLCRTGTGESAGDSEVERLRGEMERACEEVERLIEHNVELMDERERLLAAVNRAAETLRKIRDGADIVLAERFAVLAAPPVIKTAITPPVVRNHAASVPRPNGHSNITGPQQRILDSLAWWDAFGVKEPSNVQVAFMAYYSPSSTSYSNPRSALSSLGLIEYPQNDHVRLTDAGMKRAAFPEVGSRKDWQRRVFDRLKGPHRRLLEPLIESYPREMTNEQLAVAAKYSASSTSYTNPRSALSSLGLIRYPKPGYVAATEILFP